VTERKPAAERVPPESLVRDHLANERTVLAWQRTALTVMGLGFVVDRFGVGASDQGLAGVVGLALITLGAAIAVIGTYRFVRTEREIELRTFRSSVNVHVALTALLVAGAGALAAYLLIAPRGS